MHASPTGLNRYAARLAKGLLARFQAEDASERDRRWARLALRYYIARWDVIPDILPGIGMLDDALLLWLAASLLDVEPMPLGEGVTVHALEQDIERALTGRVWRTSIAD